MALLLPVIASCRYHRAQAGANEARDGSAATAAQHAQGAHPPGMHGPGATPAAPPAYSFSGGGPASILGDDPAAKTPAGARELLREHVRKNPGDVNLRTQLAAVLDSQGFSSEAEDVLRAALLRGQRAPQIFHSLGVLYLRHNQFKGAADAFVIETRLNPRSVQGHLKLGSAYSYLGRSKEALRALETALKLDPNQPDAYLGLAFLNNTSERYPYAVRYLNAYIRHAPEPAQGYALLSRVYLNMRAFDQAVDAGEKAVQSMPGNASVWYNLGQAYSYSPGGESLDKAAHAFERSVQLKPDYGYAHFELGRVYARLRRFDDAIREYQVAARYEPLQGKYFYQLGQLLLQQGRREEGNEALARSKFLVPLNQRESQLMDKITTNPRDARTIFELGRVYKKLGNHVRALSSFEAVREIDPRFPGLREELANASRVASARPAP